MRHFISVIILTFFITTNHAAQAQNQDGYWGLPDILQHVHDNNPTLKAAREELHETMELYPQARAGWLPTVSGEARLFATDIESSNFGNGTGATTKDMTVSLDQPIWRGGRTFAETARARDLIRAGEAVLSQAEQDIFLEAVTVYMNVLRDRKILDLRLHNEDILTQELHAARERMAIGDITTTDVQQARSRLARAEAERIKAEGDFDMSCAAFEDIVGMAVPDVLLVPHSRIALPTDMNDMITLAERQNPELMIIQFEQRAAEHGADATFRELLPQLAAFASYNKQYDPQPGIVDKSQTEMVGLRATITLYEGGAARSRLREARRSAKRQHYEIQETRQRIKRTVTKHWRAYQAAKAQIESRKAQITATEAALEGVRIEAREGQRTVLDVLDADQEVIDAKAALARARRDEVVAKFALANSLGLLRPDIFKDL